MSGEQYRVGVIVGSASEESLNRRVAQALASLATDAGLQLIDIPIAHLPFYGTQHDRDYPEGGRQLKEAMEGVDGILIVTPEYNRSIPAVLKNAIDWASRPGGESSWTGKPVAVTGASKGAVSTAVAQNHLKAILTAQGAAVLGAPEAYLRVGPDFFDTDGLIASEGTREFLTGFLRSFHNLIRRWR